MASVVYDKSKKFAFRVIKLYKHLIKEFDCEELMRLLSSITKITREQLENSK